jgi:hypothetical protein
LGQHRRGFRGAIWAMPRRLRRRRPGGWHSRVPRPCRRGLPAKAAHVVAADLAPVRKFKVSHKTAERAAGRRSSRCREAVRSCPHPRRRSVARPRHPVEHTRRGRPNTRRAQS